MNLPNQLTLLRIILILPFLLVLYLDVPYAEYIALAIFVAASLTDMLDGQIARKRNLITDFGKFAGQRPGPGHRRWVVRQGEDRLYDGLYRAHVPAHPSGGGHRLRGRDRGGHHLVRGGVLCEEQGLPAGYVRAFAKARRFLCAVRIIRRFLSKSPVAYRGLFCHNGLNQGENGTEREEEHTVQKLKDRIRREGKVLPGNIIKVDGFLNHRVDTRLMADMAEEFARLFDVSEITMVLTAEASGIALATICAARYGVPMVFAKKAKSDNIEGGLYQSEIYSYTYKRKVTQILSREWLTAKDRVLIVDDFMANGEAVRGLCDIVSQAGAELVGVGIAVEKGFQGGGDRLRAAGVPYHALAVIDRADEDGIVFRDEA